MLCRSLFYALCIINFGTMSYATPVPHDNNWGRPTERPMSPDIFPSMAASCYLLTRNYAPSEINPSRQLSRNNTPAPRPTSPAITVK